MDTVTTVGTPTPMGRRKASSIRRRTAKDCKLEKTAPEAPIEAEASAFQQLTFPFMNTKPSGYHSEPTTP